METAMHADEEKHRGPVATEDQDFLTRWSRRKRAAVRPPDPATPAPQTDVPRPEAPPKTDADMPSIALLTADSDLSAFFSPGVSEGLRREAMRKVFSQPRYNVVDGLDDYADDYTRFRPLGDLVTAGLRWHRQRIAARAREARDTDAIAADGEDPTAEPDSGDAEGLG
jgi:hypothetical protein